MLLDFTFFLYLLAWVLPVQVSAHHGMPAIFHRHQDLVKRSEGDLQLFKRFSSAFQAQDGRSTIRKLATLAPVGNSCLTPVSLLR